MQKAHAEDHDTIHYTHFPPKMVEVLKIWVLEGSGQINSHELMAAADVQE